MFDQERFDGLARGLATGRLSRRQVLKSFAASLLLVGPLSILREPPASAQAEGTCTQASVDACVKKAKEAYARCKRRCTHLSTDAKRRRCRSRCKRRLESRTQACQCPEPPGTCSVASRCPKKEYCSADQSCICVQSAEGDIRCGKIPSCGARLCQSSADCADLGEGYFCDTPNSACCTNPPAEKTRCIAPCDAAAPCPPERVCGAECCPEGQSCINGACSAGSASEGPCTMPASSQGCVKIGGKIRPFYYEGWFCPTSSCQSGYCAGVELGQSGRCGATAAEIRNIVSSGEGQVLEGTLPPAGPPMARMTGTEVRARQELETIPGTPARAAALAAIPSCEFVFSQGEVGRDCGGCTEGGLACFGLNSCEAGCLGEQTRGYCGESISAEKCCPSCPDARCSPNFPCRATKPNQIISDTCPPVAGVPTECQYYARRDQCVGGKCKYYSIEAPKQCEDPPVTTVGFTAEELSCVRTCLQIMDTTAFPESRTTDGCPKFDFIVNYHDRCFNKCGDSLGDLRFPTTLFCWFGDYDEGGRFQPGGCP